LQLLESDGAAVSIFVLEQHALAPDVDAHDLLPAARREERLALAREALARLHVAVVFVREAAHQPAAAPGDLRRVEREALVLRELEADGLQLAQPRGAAQLAAAPADAAQQRGLVADADLLGLDARADRAVEVAHELAEVDPPFRREEDRELVPVELPLGLAHLHLEAVVRDLLARDAANARLIGAQLDRALHLVGRCETDEPERRHGRGTAGGAARALALRDGARRG